MLIRCIEKRHGGVLIGFWVHHQDEDGNKMVNEYVREWKIGSGSYGKVVNIHLDGFLLDLTCYRKLFLLWCP